MHRIGVIIFALLLPWAGAMAGCLDYGESHRVTLTGTAFLRYDPGPPGYGETPKQDTKEGHYYLGLDRPVCVNAGGEGADEADAATGVRLMQMIYFLRLPTKKTWLGKHVAVTGWLIPWETAHHRTPVLLVPIATRVLGAAGASQ